MMAFISSKCKIVNDNGKKKARIFYRDEKGSKFKDINYEHLFTSKALGEEEIAKVRKDLENNEVLLKHNIRIEEKQYSRTKNRVLYVYGPQSIEKFLPKIFRTISAIEQLSWRFPAFAEFNPENLEIREKVDLETILKEEALTADSEASTEGRHDKNFTKLTTYSEVWKKGESVNSILREHNPDSESLLRTESKEICIIDPLAIGGHNAKYDFLDVREQHLGKGKVYAIGVDGSEPVSKARTGFLEIPYIAGRQVCCSLAFAQNWLWSTRNRLPNIVRFYGREYSKKLEGAESIDTTTEKAEAGDLEAKEILEQYCLEDNRNHFFLLEKMIRPALELAYAFETDLTSICYASKSGNAIKLRDKRTFEATHTFRASRQMDLQEFDIAKAKAELLEKAGFDFKTKRGYFDEKEVVFVAYLNLLPYALKRSLSSDRSISKLYDAIEKADNPRDKIILSQGLDAFAEELVFDLESQTSNFLFDRIYRMSREEVKFNIKAFTNSFQNFLNKNNLEIINYSDKFITMKSKDKNKELLYTLQSSDFLIPLGISEWTISATSGRTIAEVDGNIIGTEWDYQGNRGLRTDFERETLGGVIDRIDKKDFEVALAFCANQYQILRDGKVQKEKLIYKSTPREDLEDYTSKAQETRRFKDLESLDAEKDEEKRYGYAYDSGKPVSEKEFLKPDTEPAMQKYMQNMFGKLYSGYEDEFYEKGKHKGEKKPRNNGTIGDLILALENVPLRERKIDNVTLFLEGKQSTLFSFY